MKIKLLKDLQVGNKGEVVDLSEPMANYLVRMKVAEIPKQTKKKTVKKK